MDIKAIFHGNQNFFNLAENGASIAVLSSIQTGYGNSARTGKYCRGQEFYKDEETNVLSGGICKLRWILILFTLF